MRVSAKSDYALRALIELATRDGGSPVSAEELGRLQEIPHGFLQAILADLRRAGIVISQRGQSGGWRMARDAAEVSVADVIRAVDGPLVSVYGLRPEAVAYTGSADVLQHVWIAARSSLRDVFEQVSIRAARGRQAAQGGHVPDRLRGRLAAALTSARRRRPSERRTRYSSAGDRERRPDLERPRRRPPRPPRLTALGRHRRQGRQGGLARAVRPRRRRRGPGRAVDVRPRGHGPPRPRGDRGVLGPRHRAAYAASTSPSRTRSPTATRAPTSARSPRSSRTAPASTPRASSSTGWTTRG